MWACNHTLEWLNKTDAHEKDRILNIARVKNQDMKEKYKDRAKALKLKKKDTWKTEREGRSSRKTIKEKGRCCSLVSLVVRAWLSEEEAKAEILIFNEKKRKAVLQAQLAFFRNIPNITCISGLFNKAKLVGIRRFGLSWKELFENFVKVLKFFRSFQNQMRAEAKMINPDARKVTVEHQKINYG